MTLTRLVATLICLTGAAALAIDGSARGAESGLRPHNGPVPILMYHLVQKPLQDSEYPGLFVRPRDFEAQMEWLHRHGYEAVTLHRVERAWYRDTCQPGRWSSPSTMATGAST